MKRSFLVFFFLLCSVSYVFPGETVSKEAAGYYEEGVKLQKGGSFLQADTFYQKALLIDPAEPKWKRNILNNRGVMLAEQGFLEEAENNFLEALKLDANYLPAKLNLGFIYEKRRSEIESIKYWLKVLQINLDDIKPKAFVLGEVENKSSKN